jgi:hypothetical protein
MTRLPGPRGPIEQARAATALFRRPHDTLFELHRRYGPVCQVGVGPQRYVFLFGREANEHLLATDPGNFRWREALKALITVDGDTALVVTDGEDHKRRRRIVQPAFHTRKINAHLALMLEETNRTIDGWRPGQTVDAYEDLRAAVRRIVIRALFGERLRDRADDLGDRLQPALDFTNRNPVLQELKVDLPGTAWRKAKRARAAADELVYEEIAARQADGSGGDDSVDILGMLLDSELSDVELRDQVISLIAAGYDTTSAAVGWAVHAVLSQPDVRACAEAEIAALPPEPTAEEVNRLPYLDGVVAETLRLWPPGFVSGRFTVDDFELHGHRIPAGRIVLYSAYVTGRMPELWPDPDRFHPDRWRDDPVPYSFVPFGGGYRRCIGFAFATLEIKAILVQLLRRTTLEVVDPATPRPAGLSSMYPRGGVPVRVVATC